MRRPWLTSFALGAAYAVCIWLAFPPIDLWPLVFAAPAPLIVLAMKTERPWRSALAVAAAALPLWLYHERWLIDVTAPGYPLLALAMALYSGLFVWIGGRLRRARPFAGRPGLALATLPILWAGLEVGRGAVVFNGYPWYLVAHPTAGFTPWSMLASVVGVYGVGFLMAALACAIVALASGRGRPARMALGAVATAAALGALLGAGAWLGGRAERLDGAGRPLRIAVVQTNVPQSNKTHWSIEQRLADFERFLALTTDAAAQGPELIIWPETMFPGFSLNPEAVASERAAGLTQRADGESLRTTDFHDRLVAGQAATETPLIVGALARDGLRVGVDGGGYLQLEQDGLYNSAFLVVDGAVRPERYDKLKLTPFGEEMPYISASEWLESKLLAFGAAGMSFDLDTGDEPTLLRAPLEGGAELRVATPICFEATMPAVCRRLVYGEDGRRADLVANLTNDGWFGGWRGGREKHLQIARWRAIELGTPVVRAANTGISCAIDTRGNIIRRGPDSRNNAVGVDGVMIATMIISGPGAGTIYGATGDVVGWTSFALTAGILVWTFVPRSRAGRTARPGAPGAER